MASSTPSAHSRHSEPRLAEPSRGYVVILDKNSSISSLLALNTNTLTNYKLTNTNGLQDFDWTIILERANNPGGDRIELNGGPITKTINSLYSQAVSPDYINAKPTVAAGYLNIDAFSKNALYVAPVF